MEEREFWISIWKMVAVFLIITVAVMGGCSVHTNEKIESAIENGVDPVIARCALGTFNDLSICASATTLQNSCKE